MAATVLIQHGDTAPDGTPPPRAYFQLIDGKLHIPTIRDFFKLLSVRLNDVVYPTDADGFTFSSFVPNSVVHVTGDPVSAPRRIPVVLIRTSEAFAEPEQPGAKRKVTQAEENLGVWTLPPAESQPRALAELTAALRSFLQTEHNVNWLFKYRCHSDMIPITTDAALAEAFAHFRAVGAQAGDDEAAAGNQCRLYLTTISEEMAPRDIIRARISGILDAAAAGGRETAAPPAPGPASLPPAPPASSLPGLPIGVPPPDAAAAAALLGQPFLGSQSFLSQPQQAALAALAAAGLPFPQLGLSQAQMAGGGVALQPDSLVAYGGPSHDGEPPSGEDPDDDNDAGRMRFGGGYFPRPSGSDSAGGMYGGVPPGAQAAKKESKTRHADGRFKNEQQHIKKMNDMTRKIRELFDGTIANHVQVADHKRIICLLCNHACTAYSAYHTDCVRKHFLRHHEMELRERGVDVSRWRKEYEVSQKVKRQQGQQPSGGMGGGMAPLHGLGFPQSLQLAGLLPQHAGLALSAALAAATAGGALGPPLNADGAEGRPHLQAPPLNALSSVGLLQQLVNATAAALPHPISQQISALLLQAQAANQAEQLTLQQVAAGAPGAGAAAVPGAGPASGTIPGPADAEASSSGTAGASAGGSAPPAIAGPGSVSTAASVGAAAPDPPMARLASGTVTTEMPLPVHPPPPGGEGSSAPPGPSLGTGTLGTKGEVAETAEIPATALAPPAALVITTGMAQPKLES